MSEKPNEFIDDRTKERLFEAWQGLAIGFVAYTKRREPPINTTIIEAKIQITGTKHHLINSQVLSVFMGDIDELPKNLLVLLIEDDLVQMATGAQIEWQATRPLILNTFTNQIWKLDFTNEDLIKLLNSLGASMEQPHNRI